MVWKFISGISIKMRYCGAFFLVAMTALTCVDVVGRFFRHPVFGSIELMSLMAVMAVAMALPDTHETNGHIGVEIVMSRFPRKVRWGVDLVTGGLTLVLFCIITWQMFLYAWKMRLSGEVSLNLELPEYGIIFLVACCFAVFSAVILKGLFGTVNKLRGK